VLISWLHREKIYLHRKERNIEKKIYQMELLGIRHLEVYSIELDFMNEK